MYVCMYVCMFIVSMRELFSKLQGGNFLRLSFVRYNKLFTQHARSLERNPKKRKDTEQYFPVVLFIVLYKVVLSFGSVDEILKCDYSSESY